MNPPKSNLAWAAGATGAAMLMGQAVAQDLAHPPADVPDPYLGMTEPSGTLSCCNSMDCGVASPCEAPGGGLGYRERGACHPLPVDRYVEIPPDAVDRAKLHVCRTPVWDLMVYRPRVVCWTGGFGA